MYFVSVVWNFTHAHQKKKKKKKKKVKLGYIYKKVEVLDFETV